MLRTAFAKVAEFHMDNRGKLGTAFGLVAGAVAARNGFGVEFMAMLADRLFVPAGETLAQHPELLRPEWLAIPSMMLMVSCAAADAALHIVRKRRAERNAGDLQPPGV